VDLDVYDGALGDTWAYWLGGDAAGDTPYDRDTLSAVSGKTAAWAVDGSPSPFEQEIAAIDPSVAVVHYGTNDMGMGSTYDSAMPGFYEAMVELLDGLIDDGIVPVLTGISHRGDRAAADLWAETYNAVIRGLAQVRQIPFIDLHLAMDPLEDHGLSSDGLHLNGYSGGDCVLTPEGLEHGYPMRNLIVLQALDRLVSVLGDGAVSLDPADDLLEGQGSPEHPFRIDGLPFADGRDTRVSPHRDLDLYSGCDSDSDESGAEFTYQLSLARETALRAIVLDRGDVDVDVHLLDDSGTEAGCLARSDRTIEGTLPAGDYTFVLDTWVDGGGDERAGDYLFVVQVCEAGDADCSGRLD
jgi:lysophospholipase L1-like esterase